MDEARNVQQWRLDELSKLGFSRFQARQLVDIPDVVHQAQDLVLKNGCPPQLAAKILKPVQPALEILV